MDSFSIHAGSYSARVRALGGALSELKYGDRNLVDPYLEDESVPRYRGDLLAPWPNRIRDGRYNFDGREYEVPINEVERTNSLHGLVFGLNWQVVESDSTSISLSVILEESMKYPTTLRCVVTYQLSDEGLSWKIEAENIGTSRAPYGVSIHPYLIADPSVKVDVCTLKLPAAQYMEVDVDRLLPLDIRRVEEGNLDFREPTVIGDRFIDHAFLLDDGLSHSRIQLTEPSGFGVWMDSDSNAKWVQIHTADRDGGADSRICLAVEPMTCPPDAFNSGMDLVYLEPGQSHSMTWRIGII